MTYEVYIDVMFLVNFAVDLLILSVLHYFTKSYFRFYRIILAAAFGAAYAVAVFLLDFLPFYVLLPFNLLSLGVIILIMYGLIGIRKFIRQLLIFLAISFLFGGAVFGLYMTTGLSSVVMLIDGAYYFNISFLTVVLFCGFALLLSVLLYKTVRIRDFSRSVLEVTVHVFGKNFTANAIVDTGNSLTEGFSAYPVIVAEYNAVKGCLPEELRDERYFSGNENALTELPDSILKRIKLIPATTVSGTSIMTALPVDRLEIKGIGEVEKKIVIAVTNGTLSDKYSVLLNSEIF